VHQHAANVKKGAMAEPGAWANIKPMPHRANLPAFSLWLYRYRNLVERFFNKLKHSRAVATRFEKHDANYLALVKLAGTPIWIRFIESVPRQIAPTSGSTFTSTKASPERTPRPARKVMR
jgi:hypothetical protein